MEKVNLSARLKYFVYLQLRISSMYCIVIYQSRIIYMPKSQCEDMTDMTRNFSVLQRRSGCDTCLLSSNINKHAKHCTVQHA